MMPRAKIAMRCTAPPDSMLKMSSIPPCCCESSLASALGSMPGIGMKVPRRATMRSARVKKMRWRSSVALARLPKLKFAASCSAAEAISMLLNACASPARNSYRAALFSADLARRCAFLPGCPFLSVRTGFLNVSDTEPPAFLICSTAPVDAPATSMSILALSAPPKNTNAVAACASKTGAPQHVLGNFGRCVQTLALNRLLNSVEADFREIERKDVLEAPLGQAHVKRHLAAFKTVHFRAGARLRTLDAATAGFAKTGRRTATHLELPLVCPFVIGQLVESHYRFSSTTSTRFRAARIIPLTAGVSSSVRVRPILPRPSPRSVAACFSGRRYALRTWRTVTVFPSFVLMPRSRPGAVRLCRRPRGER